MQKNKNEIKSLFFIENEDDSKIKNIKWPTIKEFNEKLAMEKINEFMKNVNDVFSIKLSKVKFFIFNCLILSDMGVR